MHASLCVAWFVLDVQLVVSAPQLPLSVHLCDNLATTYSLHTCYSSSELLPGCFLECSYAQVGTVNCRIYRPEQQTGTSLLETQLLPWKYFMYLLQKLI